MPHATRQPESLTPWGVTAALVVGLLAGCGPDGDASETAAAPAPPQTHEVEHSGEVSCAPASGMYPTCGFVNPEDLAVVPGGDYLLVSEMAAFMSNAPGALSLLDIAHASREPITINWTVPAERWGDPECAVPAPARFSPHGIDLISRSDGRHQLLVVNHGDEQIEFFELARDGSAWRLHWRGCAKAPGDPFINDVAGLRDGGFFATQMWNRGLPFDEVVAKLTTGVPTGWVWEWQPATGFTKVPDSDDLMPNGIAVNADNTKLFVNIYMGNRTIRIDRATGKVEAEVSVQSPDNVVVDPDGNLWIASHLNDPIEGRCAEGHPGPCLLPFQVVRVDPVTMKSQVVLRHDGEPMGYATVALPHRGRVYLGTASGDRLASVAIP